MSRTATVVQPLRENIAGTSPYEAVIGFSRAVRVGNVVHVSGTGPVGADAADAGTQARQALQLVLRAIAQAGGSVQDVVRTRMYLTDVADWEAVGRVHGEVFGPVLPAATMVVVSQLLNPTWRVEIEAEAILPKVD